MQHWDPFIVLIISSKLDEETRHDWRQHIGRRTDTTVTELIEFLENRAIDQQPSQGDRLSQMLRGQSHQRNPKRNIFAVNNEAPAPAQASTSASAQAPTPTLARKQALQQRKKCIICKGDHYPWQCPKLRKECARVQTEMVNSVGACLKCLLKHEVGACKKSDCPYCGEDHNSLLCIKKERDQTTAEQTKRKLQPQPKRETAGDPSTDDWSNIQ